jgi:hypothetical protein
MTEVLGNTYLISNVKSGQLLTTTGNFLTAPVVQTPTWAGAYNDRQAWHLQLSP